MHSLEEFINSLKEFGIKVSFRELEELIKDITPHASFLDD
jgi:hypothetical protein